MGEVSEALRRSRETSAGATTALGSLVAAAREGRPAASAGATVVLPEEESPSDGARIVLTRPASPMAESYRHAAVVIERTLNERGARSLLIASAGSGEGKTTTTCNLALAIASMAGDRRTAILELDLRRPSAAQALGVSRPVGIEAAFEDVQRLPAVRCGTQIPQLDLYLAKGGAENPLALVSSPRLGALIRALEKDYQIVIVDSPPVLPVPDSALIARNVGTVLLVARAGMSRRGAIEEAVVKLGRSALIGIFLNDRRDPRHRRYAEYYSYGDPSQSEEAVKRS